MSLSEKLISRPVSRCLIRDSFKFGDRFRTGWTWSDWLFTASLLSLHSTLFASPALHKISLLVYWFSYWIDKKMEVLLPWWSHIIFCYNKIYAIMIHPILRNIVAQSHHKSYWHHLSYIPYAVTTKSIHVNTSK